MIRWRTILVAGLLAFGAGYFAGTIVYQKQGPHTWFRAQQALKRAKWPLEEYQSLNGEYPDEDTVNLWIDLIWTQKGRGSPRSDEVEFDLVDLASELRVLSRWEKPVYVVSESIPGGSGFYSPGDDGVTSSHGNDVDDINSWDSRSKIYYLKKQRWEDRLEYAFLGVISCLVVTLMLIAQRWEQVKATASKVE